MIHTRRFGLLIFIFTLVLMFSYLRTSHHQLPKPSLGRVSQYIGLGDLYEDDDGSDNATDAATRGHQYGQLQSKPKEAPTFGDIKILGGPFEKGLPKPKGRNYTRNLIIAKTKDAEGTEWIDEEDLGGDINRMVYIVDDPNAPLHPPTNKGHEVMVYLTYIIDYYHNLSDISIFMHSHRYAWHNNEVLGTDSAETVRRLNSERVQREGYMNLRCYWGPGCPDWMHPGATEANSEKEEETMMAHAWSEIFPEWDVPYVLASACCAQFALSRERIHVLPLERYLYFRDWMLNTRLEDKISGRVWEYLWHVIFTGQEVFCPSAYDCYCDGYGVCFENDDELNKWYEHDFDKFDAQDKLDQWYDKANRLEEQRKQKGSHHLEVADIEVPEMGKDIELQIKLSWLNMAMDQKKQTAVERGDRLREEMQRTTLADIS